MEEQVRIQIKDTESNPLLPETQISTSVTSSHINALLRALSPESHKDYSFFVKGLPLSSTIAAVPDLSSETILEITAIANSQTGLGGLGTAPFRLVGHQQAVLTLHFPSEPNRLISGGGDGAVICWDLNTSTPVWKNTGAQQGWVLASASSPGLFFTGDSQGRLVVWKDNANVTSLKLSGGSITRILVTKRRIIVGTSSGRIHQGEVLIESPFVKINFALNALGLVRFVKELSPGLAIIGGDFRNPFVLKAGDRSILKELTGHSAETGNASVFKQEILATSGKDCSIIVRRFKTGPTGIEFEPEKRLCGHVKEVYKTAFSTNGTLLASSSADTTVRVWNLVNGACLGSLRGHVGAVYHVLFSRDGRLLLSAGEDGTAKLWDVGAMNFHKDFVGHEGKVFAMEVDEEQGYLATGSEKGEIIIRKQNI